ncbi:DUF3137 domain-containing protein [Shewanella sp. D64]|uniref:DUF3137 domain-containing protein n=1 Tax=unclassified Shewanella TaxID=196818 RepID=UPI0022BA5A3E|nr:MULTISPECIES: DUF3137 domain-containing protein [unclassified Shewanella]MEC4725876.1 DUF3137 domain-containing protein [Shewanella sp. D64]MEC4737131.1 DUF3137 domain-containing protein [Shewanella sp. E94]WBJ95676.1 DUF3137 domain-containing protein [Shewanella sp. MTB7]
MNIISFIFGAPIKPKRQSKPLVAVDDELSSLQVHYDEYIEPLTRKFENRRVATLKTLRQRFYMSLAIFLGIFFVSILIDRQQRLMIPWVFFLLPLIPLVWWSFRPVSRYKSDVKERVYPKIFRYFGDDFIFSPTDSMNLSTLKRSKLLPSYDDANFEDYVQGTYKGIEIAINELELTKEVKRNKRHESQRVFKGVMVQLSCHKKFIGHTVVVKTRGGFINFISDSFKSLSRAKLEDVRFEKQFDVFSSDQIEARFLLTVTFMERLQELASCFSGKIQCAFYEDKLLIMLASSENRFELGSIFNGATFEYEFSQINKEMRQLFAMIEVLKLDEYTGL